MGAGMGPSRDRLSRRHQAVPQRAGGALDRAKWRRRLEEVRLRGLECFAAAGLGLGGPAPAQAEERARMLTELAPYRETGHRLLMEALAQRGNVAEALRAYERLRILLRHEMGIVPSPTVQDVHRRLLQYPRC